MNHIPSKWAEEPVREPKEQTEVDSKQNRPRGRAAVALGIGVLVGLGLIIGFGAWGHMQRRAATVAVLNAQHEQCQLCGPRL